MATKEQMQQWEEISTALFRALIPTGSTEEVMGIGMKPSDFSRLVDIESARVDKVLIAMAISKEQEGVQALINNLSKDTMIALFSRWAHHIDRLMKHSLDQPWIPPSDEIWRGVLLSMCQDKQASLNISLSLWPDAPVFPVEE